MSTNKTPDEDKLLFDERLTEKFRQTINEAFLEVPELRSVVVTFDYFRNLNDAPNITKGLWLAADADGADKPTDAIVGSLGASLQNTAHILDELFQRYEMLRLQLTELSKAIMDKTKEL